MTDHEGGIEFAGHDAEGEEEKVSFGRRRNEERGREESDATRRDEYRRIKTKDSLVVKNLLPVEMNGSLTISLESDPLLHERTDLESVSDGRVWKLIKRKKRYQPSFSHALSSGSSQVSRDIATRKALYFPLVGKWTHRQR